MQDQAPPPGMSEADWAATPPAVRALVQALLQRVARLETHLKQTSRKSSQPPSSAPCATASGKRALGPQVGRAAGAYGGRPLFGLWYRVRDGPVAWADLQVARLPLMARVRTRLPDGVTGADAKTQGTGRNLLKRKAALWTFGWEPGGEATNTCAERPLRRAVWWRRCSFGTQSAAGSQFGERILTAVTTLRQPRRDVLAYLTAACTAALRQESAPSLLPLTSPPLSAR